MTCIAGLVHDGKVYIGGDSAGVDGRYSLTVRADRKVFRNGDFIMGFTSSFRMGQLLAYALKPPRRHPDDDVYAYMVTEFIDAVRECLKKGGYAEKKNETEQAGTFLVGYVGRLFCIEDDYQVGENVDGFAACGCGDLIALGALSATNGQKPEARVKAALKAAERFSAGVRQPFHIESI
jgi:ATP-dependent protease HslVU (ClpYQ) peptidase subunit